MEGSAPEGVLLVDKPTGKSSFAMVSILRRRVGQRKVGHAGTLDPFASGLLVLLFGRSWTKCANLFVSHDKEYTASIRLGISTDTFDRDGTITSTSSIRPLEDEVHKILQSFQGEYLQTPPMFSAKKVGGKRLYDLARKGISISREQRPVQITTTIDSYEYPFLNIRLKCSKGTYVRAIASDIGERLGCHAHVAELRRMRSGPFHITEAVSLSQLDLMTKEEIVSRFFSPEGL